MPFEPAMEGRPGVAVLEPGFIHHVEPARSRAVRLPRVSVKRRSTELDAVVMIIFKASATAIILSMRRVSGNLCYPCLAMPRQVIVRVAESMPCTDKRRGHSAAQATRAVIAYLVHRNGAYKRVSRTVLDAHALSKMDKGAWSASPGRQALP